MNENITNQELEMANNQIQEKTSIPKKDIVDRLCEHIESDEEFRKALEMLA